MMVLPRVFNVYHVLYIYKYLEMLHSSSSSSSSSTVVAKEDEGEETPVPVNIIVYTCKIRIIYIINNSRNSVRYHYVILVMFCSVGPVYKKTSQLFACDFEPQW